MLIGASVLFVNINGNLLRVFYLVVLPYLIFVLAYLPKGKVLKFNKYGDYSYGVYIWAFPIQQIVVWQLPSLNIIEHAGVAFALTLPIAMLSWNLIEKKALKLKSNREKI
jgi:peptidoglycan/LPS O-acetylase OafA/YrhL